MFYYIKGTIAHIEPSLAVIDACGVGYAINTAFRSGQAPRVGEEAIFYTHLQVREDLFELYGFATSEELGTFKQLIGISGVGPKAALAILGVVSPEQLAVAVISDDEKTITKAPGVGKKLAQRILLELKDKLLSGSALPGGLPGDGAALSVAGGGREDVLAALSALGYSRAQAFAALANIDTSALSVEEAVRAALKQLY